MVKLLVWGGLGLGILIGCEVVLAYFTFIESGSQLCETLQDSSNLALDGFWVVLVTISYPLIYICVVSVFYFFSARAGMEIACLAATCEAVCNLMKFAIAYPRPFWYSEDVEGYTCSFQFGDPSGHALVSTGVYCYFVWRLGLRVEYYIAVGAIEILIAFERIYGGLHTYSQILLGISVGIYLNFVFREFQPYISASIKSLKHSLLSIPATIFTFATLSISLILYIFRNPWWDEDWNDNVEEDCEDFDSNVALKSQFLGTLFIFFFIGSLFAYHMLKKERVSIKRCALWHKFCFVFACIAVYVIASVITSLETGVFEIEIILEIFTDFFEGFFCFGGMCLPFNFLKKPPKKTHETRSLKNNESEANEETITDKEQ